MAHGVYHHEIWQTVLWVCDEHFQQISSNSEMVMLEPFAELTVKMLLADRGLNYNLRNWKYSAS